MLNNDVMFSDLNLASGLFRKVLKNLDPMKLTLRHITILNVLSIQQSFHFKLG